MIFSSIQFHQLDFSYPGSSYQLLQTMNLHFGKGWTGIVGPNGSGKSTILELAIGNLKPTRGQVTLVEGSVMCSQQTDDPPAQFEEFIEAYDGLACQLRGKLGIEWDWADKWKCLSHGERKRAQIGTALWQEPAVLAIDEPTNHIDQAARALLMEALATYRGVGLLVSHDRELLDALCSHCVFVDSPHATLRPGGFTAGSEEAEREYLGRAREIDHLNEESKRLARETQRRREEVTKSAKKLSRRNIAPKDHDAKDKVNRARNSSKDAGAGNQHRQMQSRLGQIQKNLDSLSHGHRSKPSLGIQFTVKQTRNTTVMRCQADELALGDTRRLTIPELLVSSTDRIGISGPNGGGKSTLLQHLLSHTTRDDILYIPQEIGRENSRALLESSKSLPKETLGHLLTVINCLGSSPKQLLASRQPSPGEARKLLLATGMVEGRAFIALDEPTNHLDLPSIECLEDALEAYPCGLLLVSHDEHFLSRLTKQRWKIEGEPNSELTITA